MQTKRRLRTKTKKKLMIACGVVVAIIQIIIIVFIGKMLVDYSHTRDKEEAMGQAVLSSLPDYTDFHEYTYGFFIDFTFYGEYYYKNVVAEDLESTGYFVPVIDARKKALSKYVKDFESCVAETAGAGKIIGDDLTKVYKFSADMIDNEDWYYIRQQELMENVTNGARIRDSGLECYDIYYFDMQTQTLYHIHHDI